MLFGKEKLNFCGGSSQLKKCKSTTPDSAKNRGCALYFAMLLVCFNYSARAKNSGISIGCVQNFDSLFDVGVIA